MANQHKERCLKWGKHKAEKLSFFWLFKTSVDIFKKDLLLS